MAVAAVLAAIAVVSWTPDPVHRPGPASSDSPSDQPPAVGPIVYYEVLDAEGSRLMERRLDGRSLAREVSIADGAPLWSIRTPSAPVDQAVWSTDGRRLGLASIGGDSGPRVALTIDAASGRFIRATIPDDAILQGFDRDGALILRQHVPSPQGVNVGWRFLRIDPVTGTLDPLVALPDVGPASDWSEDVDPAARLAVDTTIGANDQGTAIRFWSLGGGASRVLATLPSIDRIAIDPGGTGVAISAAQTIRFVGFDGRAGDLFSGPDPIADFGWSVEGDFLAVTTDRRGPNLTIVERATGRSVAVPHPEAIAQLLLVRVVGGVPLPAVPLPASEPTPSPTPGPAGPDVADFGGLLSAWVDRTGDTQVVHVQRLVPTEAGGLRVAAEMPPLDLGPAPVPDDGGPEVQLLPRPGSTDLLVWIGTAERSSGWLWDGAARLEVMTLPADWPGNAYDVAWRPDGLALAASAGRATPEGEFQGIFVVASPADRATTVVPVVGDYDRLEGWWSTTELRVGHGICTEGCEGRYAWSARLGIADHRLVQLTPADRAHAPIDSAAVEGSTIVLSMVNDDRSDDVVIDWPAGLGATEALDPIGFASDGRSLILAQSTADGTDLYRIDDPAGRAVAGRLADPGPIRLVHLEGRGLRITVSPDDGWATVVDRVDGVRLVRLADGRSWPVDRERTLAWPGGG
jgi:hypothetical protein